MFAALTFVCLVALLGLIVAALLRLRAKRRQPFDYDGYDEISDEEVLGAIRTVPTHFTQTFWGGQGGTVEFTPKGGSQMTVANKSWKFKRANKVNEVTNAGSDDQEQWIAGVSGQEGSFEVFWDSTLPPESNGLYDGNTGTLILNLGASGHYYSQTVIIVSIEPALDAQQGAIMYTVSYKGITSVTYT